MIRFRLLVTEVGWIEVFLFEADADELPDDAKDNPADAVSDYIDDNQASSWLGFQLADHTDIWLRPHAILGVADVRP